MGKLTSLSLSFCAASLINHFVSLLTPALKDYSVTTCVTQAGFPWDSKGFIYLYQLGFLSHNEMTWPRLQKGMRATLLYAHSLFIAVGQGAGSCLAQEGEVLTAHHSLWPASKAEESLET